jgi:hypothetical protein
LNRAYEELDSSILEEPLITVDPDMKELREHAGYKAFLRKMNLPE